MGGQQPTTKEYPYAKYFNNEGNPYNKSQDEKLKDLKAELKTFAHQVWDDISMLYVYEEMDTNTSEALRNEIASLKKEIDFLKQQITNGSTGKWGTYANKEEMQGTFDLYRQMQVLLKQEFDKLKSNFESALSGLVVVKPTVEAKKQPIKVEPPKDDLDGWMNLSEFTKYVLELIEGGNAKINPDFGRVGKIGDLFIMLYIVKQRRSSKAGRTVIPTGYGESNGYVKILRNDVGNGPCLYNVEKCKAILEEASKDPFGTIKKHSDASKRYYEGAGA